jgi:predicted SAM-dependent methyltransferase
MIKLSLGCGGIRLDGWLHLDIDQQWRPDVQADLSKPLPVADQSVDFIHSEDFIDQIPLADGIHFLSECYRVLKPNGVLRLLTPDLKALVSMYLENDMRLLQLWETGVGLPMHTRTLAEVVNDGVRKCGHQFVYDEQTLRLMATKAGFECYRVDYQQSAYAELRGLDYRTPDDSLSMYFECLKK